MDLQMGAGMDGVTATARIKANGDAGKASPPVLILTTYDTDADILAAVEAGAAGYMLKDAPPEQIRNPVPALSAREVQLVELLATGMPNKEIARKLFISEATVTWCTFTPSSAWTTARQPSPKPPSAASSVGPDFENKGAVQAQGAGHEFPAATGAVIP